MNRNDDDSFGFENIAKQLDDKITDARRWLREEQEKLKKDRAQFEVEKAKVTILTGACEDDIITINAGGDIITTTRGTLCTIPNSILANMFSGKWEEKIRKDKDERIFLDINGYCFRKIIDAFRLHRISNIQPQNEDEEEIQIPVPDIMSDMKFEFRTICAHFGLENTFFPKSIEFIATNSITCTRIQNSLTILTHTTNNTHNYAISKTPFSVGEVIKLRVDVLTNNNWVYIGIIENTSPKSVSYSDSTSFGWASKSQVYRGGVNGDQDNWSGFKERDEVLLSIDPNGENLVMIVKRLGRYSIPIQRSSICWYIHLNFFSNNDKVSILRPTMNEIQQIRNEYFQ